jgi:hypothetical protein
MSTRLGAAAAPVVASVARVHPDRRFFMAMAATIAVVVFVGFAPTFYLRPAFHPEPLPAVFAVHGTIFTAWILLFIVQTTLVSTRRTDIHKKLGLVGAALAALMVVVGYRAAVTAASRGFATPGLPPPLVFFAIPFFDLLVFAPLVALALYFRRRAATHKRLMLLATIAIVTAAIARLPYILPLGPLMFFGLTDLLAVAAIIYDRSTLGRSHRATLWGTLFLVASQVTRLVVSGTATWLAFARWATGA